MAYGDNAPFGLRPVSSITGGAWDGKTNEYTIYTDANGQNSYGTSLFTGDPVILNRSAANLALRGTDIAVYDSNRTPGTPTTYPDAYPILGVFMGCSYTDVTTGRLEYSKYYPANLRVKPKTPITAYVLDDPSVLFEVQISVFGDADIRNPGNNQYQDFTGLPYFPNTSATAAYKGGVGSNFALVTGGGTNFTTIQTANKILAGYQNNPAAGNILTGQSAFYLEASSGDPTDATTRDYNKTLVGLPFKVLGLSKHPKNIARTVNGVQLTLQTTPFLNVVGIINNHVFGHNSVGQTYA
jgi:hypothetical protein